LSFKKKLAAIGLIFTLVAGIISAFLIIGREARLVDVLILYFSGLGAGLSVAALIRRRKKE